MKFLVAVLLISFSSGSNADNWAFNFQAEKDLGFDDNVTMSDDPQESFFYRFLPTLAALHQTEVSEIKAKASYGTQRYINIDGFDFIIQEYGIHSLFRTEKTDFGFAADYIARPHLDTAQEDSGDFNTSSIRKTASIKPFFSYQLTGIDNIGLTGGYIKRTSTDENFSDIDNHDINFIWARQWAESFSSNVSVFYEKFEFNERSSSSIDETISDNYGINFSSNVLITDSFSIKGGVGFRHTETEEKSKVEGSNKRSSNGFITAISINYEGERLSSNFTINRSLVPSSRGQLNEQSALVLKLNYKITENLYMLFLADYRQSERESNDDDDERKRKNINVNPSLNWKTSEYLLISGSYRYRFEDDSEDDFIANSNLFMLSAKFNYGFD